MTENGKKILEKIVNLVVTPFGNAMGAKMYLATEDGEYGYFEIDNRERTLSYENITAAQYFSEVQKIIAEKGEHALYASKEIKPKS